MLSFLARLLCFVCFLMIQTMAAANAAPGERVIRNDPGGQLQQYLNDLSGVILSGEVIKVEGWCASACTIYLGSPFTCVTPQAQFGFHAPFGGTVEQNRHATEVMISKFPRALGRWFIQNAAHLEGRKYVALSGAQIVAMGASHYC